MSTDYEAKTAAGVPDNERAEKQSMADRLAALASESFRIGRRVDDGVPFAVWREGSSARPNLALPLKGVTGSMTGALCKAYRDRFGKIASGGSVSDVLAAIEGDAAESEPEPVGLRVAMLPDGHGVALDLGTVDGRAVVVTAEGWRLVNRSPLLMRRTALTAPMVEPVSPEAGQGLTRLRELLNVHADDWPIIIAWMVAALLPSEPCPILLLGGMQGTGKSTAARLIRGVVDPSKAPLIGEPHNGEQWAMYTTGSRVLAVDNISTIPPWWSDALCCVVTGTGTVRRALYTDSDLAVTSAKRAVILTSIDAGALRGDLANRIVSADLMPMRQRLTEAALNASYEAALPSILGDLLDTVVGVLRAKANGISVKLNPDDRMADFCELLAQLDHARPDLTGGNAHELHARQRGRLAADVVNDDAVAAAVKALAESAVEWSGTAGDLLETLSAVGGYVKANGGKHQPRSWPTSPRKLTALLKRLMPALAAVGVRVDMSDTRTNAGRLYRVSLDEPDASRKATATPSQPSHKHADATTRHQHGDDRDCRDGVPEKPRPVLCNGGTPDQSDERLIAVHKAACDAGYPALRLHPGIHIKSGVHAWTDAVPGLQPRDLGRVLRSLTSSPSKT
ncbi:MAG: ATP-binding protein [Pseudomonadota bacterium]